MKCFFIVTKSETVLSFRRGLIESLLQNGHSVGIIAHDDEQKDDILNLGVSFYCVEQDNRDLNPFAIIDYQKRVEAIFHREQPDVVFTFMLKPNTFGSWAANRAGVKRIFSMVEGAGDVFINDSVKWKLIRFVTCYLYKRSFKKAKKVFFLNQDDKREFVARRILPEEKCQVIPGIGVDLERFAFAPVKNDRTFLMVARMLKTKGVLDYCRCARIVKQKYPDAVFHYLGAEGTVALTDIQEYIDDGSICYLGTTKDVRPLLEDCTALLLPSSREGMPMSIMEAEAVGRGVITYDCVGCKDTVTDGYNGYVVPLGDYEAMAERCIRMIENPEKMVEMGKNSRQLAAEKFDQKKINQMLTQMIETV